MNPAERARISRLLLDAVSRSFALAIPLLDGAKLAEVENQYLLDRLLDTVEDSDHSLEDKRRLMGGFVQALRDESSSGLAALLAALRERTINEHDKTLIDQFDAVFETFLSFPEAVRAIAVEQLVEMGEGMLEFRERPVLTFDDLDEYCYYVAGTVGVYLTRLVEIKDNVALRRDHAVQFGRYLQKVNIIKDFYKDYLEGRLFWPCELFDHASPEDIINHKSDRGERMRILDAMTASAKQEESATFEYIKAIPAHLRNYRSFCLIPALMARETLKRMEGNDGVFFREEGVKIPRALVMAIVAKDQTGYYTNAQIDKYLDTSLE
ncbi:MAG: squalene/phytoene synthase family protein [Candidatus Sumerlaeota bacterium]|nr:squalene/phytoene synthase family protein [Candidatus Sumerlaeota bacterium]